MRMIMVVAGLILAASGMIGGLIGGGKPSDGPVKEAAKATPVVAAATVSTAPRSNALRSVTIPRDARGHFQTEGRIDGRRVDFMVDTGASVIALTEREAGRLGIRPPRNEFTAQMRTANGIVKVAPVMLSSVDVGGLVVRNVQALVVPGEALGENLLGLSYLTKLKRFEYSNGKLVLEQ